jgi:hypothetical protein
VGVIDCSCAVTAGILSWSRVLGGQCPGIDPPSALSVNANNPVKGMYHNTDPASRPPRYFVLEFDGSQPH